MPHVSRGTLHAYLDGALDDVAAASAEVREHIHRCSACSARLAEERTVRDAAAAILDRAGWPVDVPPFEDLRRRAALADEGAGDGKTGRVTRLAWAASIVLALGTGWVLGGRTDGPVSVRLAQGAVEALPSGGRPEAGSPSDTVDLPIRGVEKPVSEVSAPEEPGLGSMAEAPTGARLAPATDANVDGNDGTGTGGPGNEELAAALRTSLMAAEIASTPADHEPLVSEAFPPRPSAPLRALSDGGSVGDRLAMYADRSDSSVGPCIAQAETPVMPTDMPYRNTLPARRSARTYELSSVSGRSVGRASLTAAAVLPVALAGCRPAVVRQTASVEEAVATITEEDFVRKVGVIAHDSMGGRATPSEGLEMTAAWIAAEFERIGLAGGAEDGSFIQRYPVRRVTIEKESSLRIGEATLRLGPDLFPLMGRLAPLQARGEIVLVPDEVAFETERAAGKHVVLLRPQGLNRELLREIADIRNAGAASVAVAISESASRSPWGDGLPRALPPSVGKGWSQTGTTGPPAFFVRLEALVEALDETAVDYGEVVDGAGGPLETGVEATLAIAAREETLEAPNVVGILKGGDPELSDEYLAYSAHMDHVGVGAPNEEGDSIYNGADDDASGTIAVVEVAEAMAALAEPPRRSVLFLLVSGEELGLWGSEWFSDNPTVPVESMVANLNADMVGRNWTDTIVAIGKEHSDLGSTLERVNQAHPELGMTAIDDLWPDQNFYYRSDHFNFARKGVPVLFFFNGTHEDYHGPNDETDRIDAEKASRIARLLFHLGLEIANADERPTWYPESYANVVGSR